MLAQLLQAIASLNFVMYLQHVLISQSGAKKQFRLSLAIAYRITEVARRVHEKRVKVAGLYFFATGQNK